jgi:UDP:flavonoid glycosyltransferase YjiC (YdhE family)
VLFCVIPEKGHINPYIGPAQALLAAGHEVTFYAPGDITAQLAAAGIDRFVGPRGTATESEHRGPAFAERIRDAAWLRGWIRSLLVDAADAQVEPLRALIRSVKPDVVAIDPLMYAAAIASELERVPWAAISNSLNPALPDTLDSELLRTVRWLAADRDALFARHGLRASFRGCDVLSPHLTVAFTTRELVGDVLGVELVGPSLPRRQRGDEVDFPWEWLDRDKPLVYASFGSQIGYQPALFRRLLDAVAPRRVQLVASASELATSGELGALPSNVLLRPYLPQLALLKRAAVMITHGGANSVMESIAHAVPLLLVPLCNDQFHQVHFVEHAGIGRHLHAERCSAADIGAAIDALAAMRSERVEMNRVAKSYQRLDGAGETARLLTELAARSRPARES